MIIRTASERDAAAVLDFYYALIDAMRENPYRPTWTRDVYPTKAHLDPAIEEGNLFVAEENGVILGAFILNEIQGEGYDRAPWSRKTDAVSVIHLLGVSPAQHGRGIGSALLAAARETALARGSEVIRLDTLPHNKPARTMYERFGFRFCGELTLDYPSAGRIPFAMYEYLL